MVGDWDLELLAETNVVNWFKPLKIYEGMCGFSAWSS